MKIESENHWNKIKTNKIQKTQKQINFSYFQTLFLVGPVLVKNFYKDLYIYIH